MPAVRLIRAVRSAAITWSGLRFLRVFAFPLLVALGNAQPAATNVVMLPRFEVSKAREYLRELEETMAHQLPTNAEARYARARVLGGLGEKTKAETLAKQALELEPNRAEIAMFLADLYVRQDRMEEAAAILKQAIRANPLVPGGKQQLGMVLDRLGQPEEAEGLFSQAIKDNPKDPAAPLLLGRFLLDRSRISEAVTNLELSCRLDTNSANPYYPLFQAYSKQGRKEAAQEALQRFKALKKVETSDMGVMTDTSFDNEGELRVYAATLHTGIGNIFRQQGQKALAEAHFLQATRIDPRRPEGFEALSDFYVQEGRLEEGLAPIKKVIELSPDRTWPRVNYGTLLLRLNRTGEGLEELQRVLNTDPKQPQALYNVSRQFLASKQQLPKALEYAQRLVEVDPSGTSYDLLGWAFYANGRTNDALQALSQAIKKAPENPAIRQRYERLRTMSGAK